ncbi:ninein isoform X2 [Sphaeramia orbicularis]|uniref:ninein isoform X2 n=1 Tax=Sphaeramia orbicularis TaxID=375764 RepID=UPI00117E677D|nr:ninein isoform X2 [Sphaeramia orbicularis]
MNVLSGALAGHIHGRLLSCGMGDAPEQDHYVEQLKEVFNSFDTSGCGSLSSEELAELCRSLHLDDTTPALISALQQNQDLDQDCRTARVDFDQFKNALILVLSSKIETPQPELETLPKPEHFTESPEIQPKFVKGSKRYGRRSTPEFFEPIFDSTEATISNATHQRDLEDSDDSAVPRKRERWNARETSSEEYEADGQMHLWNPDEPSTPRGSILSLSSRLEERLHEACDNLALPWEGCARHTDLLTVCEHLGLEINGEVLQSLRTDGMMSVQEFVSRIVNNTPPTPSASTPYRQLKRLHSTQPFDEGGRRIATPSALTSTIGMRLFSTLDDGTGYTAVECVLDAWMEEGIENSADILQMLNFSLDGKLSLGDLTMALENELLVTKNGIHQAAVASFKAEIRYLLECVDKELREKEKIQSDLEKAEKLKSQFATEVDEHHSAIEHMYNLNLRKLEQDHKEKLALVRSELMKEMDHIQQQASLQREELEAEVKRIRDDESFLRDHLSISVKENRRLEMEVLDSTEKLVEAQSQITKLQTNLDNIMKEKFGDLDPGSADLFLQEERIKQLRSSYEAQCRDLQDRIDELQSELQEFHSLGRVHQPSHKPLSEELESKSPGMESDPGIGSEEVQPFSLSLEAEMMLEQLKQQHLQEMEDLRNQLESKIREFDKMVEKRHETSYEHQKATLALQYQQEVQALREEKTSIQSHAEDLQRRLEQAMLERSHLEKKQAKEREELENLQEEEVQTLRQQLLEAHAKTADLDEHLKTLEAQQEEANQNYATEMEELKKQHSTEMKKLEEKHKEELEARIEEERKNLQDDKNEWEKRLLHDTEREKEVLQQKYEDQLRARIDEVKLKFEEERAETVKSLTEQWQKERAELDERNSEALQALLEEEMLRLVQEHEHKESKMKSQWANERARLQEQQEEALLERILQQEAQLEQREQKLKEEWEREKLQLEEDYEGMLQERMKDEREKLELEKEEAEKKLEHLMAEDRARLEKSHGEAIQELTAKHQKERDTLSSMLDKLRDDIAQERREIEISFTQRIREVEERFSDNQESAAEGFQADVVKLEQHYQNELKTLSERHMEQKCHWETQIQITLESAENQKRSAEETMKQEEERLNQKWTQEVQEIENVHKEIMEELIMKNEQLQNELDKFVCLAQTREIELSKQLNELHNRLQDSLETKDELLAQSERRVLEAEALLNQAVEDFQQERMELLNSHSELEAKHKEILSMSERQTDDRIKLMSERDDLKMKIEELEMFMKQAAADFDAERKELEGNISILEGKLKDDREELLEEHDLLGGKVKELEMEAGQVFTIIEKVEKNETEEESNGIITPMENSSEGHGIWSATLETPEYEVNEQNVSAKAITETLNIVDGSCEGITKVDYENNPDIYVDHESSEPQVTVDDERCESEDVGCENDVGNTSGDYKLEGLIPEENPVAMFSSDVGVYHSEDHHDCNQDVPVLNKSHDGVFKMSKYKERAVPSRGKHKVNTVSPLLEAFEGVDAAKDGENEMSAESCEAENQPQDVPASDAGSCSHEDEQNHETVVEHLTLEEMGELLMEDAERNCSNVCHIPGITVELICDSECEPLLETKDTKTITHEYLKVPIEEGDCEVQDHTLMKVETLYKNASEENTLLHEKISLLQQKTEILELLLIHNSEKIKTSRHVLEENYSLKVRMLLLMEHVKELEVKTLRMTQLQIQYEDCTCENAKLKDQNNELERRVWSLESRMNIYRDCPGQRMALIDDIGRMREENVKLSELLDDLDRTQDGILYVDHTSCPWSSSENVFLDLNIQVQAGKDLEDHCVELKKHNSRLRRAIMELQDRSQTLNETTQNHRSEASHLSVENSLLRQKIAALKEEELKEAQEELRQTLEQLQKEKTASEKAADDFNKQISELRSQSQHVEDKNGILSQKNAQSLANLEELQQQLAELIQDDDKREAFPAEEKLKLAACVSALEAELTKALEDTAQLEERNKRLSQEVCDLQQKVDVMDSMESELSNLVEERKHLDEETRVLCSQLAKAQEEVKTGDETLQAVNHQTTRLKYDLRVVQQERESLQQEVTLLHKKLRNANDKNHVLEMALTSSGLQNQSKKLYRDEMCRLMEQEKQLLKQENDKLQEELISVKADLVQSREKVRQLDVTVLCLKQHKQSQSAFVKELQQEIDALKQELETQEELTKVHEAGGGQTELESLQQENEALKAQMSQLSTQLIESFQAQLVGLLPPSPHRAPRRQHRAEDQDHMQEESLRKMKNMEERMREIELSLHNVKLLLKEKVTQLKDQLHKNVKADVLIKDLYVENSQLLKALEVTEQRQKIAEKKNYLLEEKISSLNRIVRDLNPASHPTLSIFKCS